MSTLTKQLTSEDGIGTFRGMGKTIQIVCQGAETRSIDELEEFQGDLKSLSEENYRKLRNEIVREGFAFPVHIWDDRESETTYILGGHQRIRVLKKMRDEEGYEIPPIPVVVVQAKDWKAAKRHVLQDVSQYGKVEKDGLYAFVTQADISFEDLTDSFDIPQVSMDLEKFGEEFFHDADTITVSEHERSINEKEIDENIKTTYECPSCGYKW